MKNNVKPILALLMVVVLAIACGPGKTGGEGDEAAQEQNAQADAPKSLKDEVMAIHDEVMPKMGQIIALKSQLSKVLKTLEEAAEPVNEERKKAIQEIIEELEAADNGMMGWMRAYRPVEEPIDEEARKYLEAEKVKITKVKNDMLTSIENAQNLLKEEGIEATESHDHAGHDHSSHSK